MCLYYIADGNQNNEEIHRGASSQVFIITVERILCKLC